LFIIIKNASRNDFKLLFALGFCNKNFIYASLVNFWSDLCTVFGFCQKNTKETSKVHGGQSALHFSGIPKKHLNQYEKGIFIKCYPKTNGS
jgi:homoserine trans-succinylase